MKRGLLFGLLLVVACACARGPKVVRPAPAWTRDEPLSWADCDKGSTLVMRRTPGDGGAPHLVRHRRMDSGDSTMVRIQIGPHSFHGLFIGYPWGGPVSTDKFLRRDRLEVDGESVPVEVFERTTSWPGGGLCGVGLGAVGPRSLLVEEVWKRVDAPPAEGPLRVRYDRVHSVFLPGDRAPPVSALRVADAEGFVDTRRVLGRRQEAVIDGWVYSCLPVRTWDDNDIPLDSLECPGVLGGRARWEEVYRIGNVLKWKNRFEVVSFDCRR
ncbi:hypothetical protein JQX13_20965 [Archangium violaceum]|uniref:hypothetical protein n=1 Tax=Archangium violaceum TaxID=83451 RepID=UPI00193B387D|nr:hypothetical protein [Archangium violaceum]QRK12277.1 hypothetical protein JQX13_20965 [Archangium violaceum]